MNYLWEVVLAAENAGINQEDIRFRHSMNGGPYMEVSLDALNQEDIRGIEEIEVNTYNRFYSIFHEMFLPESQEYPSLRKSLANLIMHMIAANDVRSGMTKEEYHKKMLLQNILAGCFGEERKKYVTWFNNAQREVLLSGWLKSYQAGSSLSLFIHMIHAMIDNSVVYHGKDKPDEILIYTSLKNTIESEQKLSLLIDVFLPVRYQVSIFYEYHFGIIGVEETMVIDEIAIF